MRKNDKRHFTGKKMKLAYLIDIDGTIACKAPDRHIHDFKRVGEDTLYEDVAKLIWCLQEWEREEEKYDFFMETWKKEPIPFFSMIYVTARNEICRRQTESWLLHNNFRIDELYMREQYDTRFDWEVKQNIYWKHIYKNYHVLGVFEDRNNVVKMYRDLGLTVYQVRENAAVNW